MHERTSHRVGRRRSWRRIDLIGASRSTGADGITAALNGGYWKGRLEEVQVEAGLRRGHA